MTRLILRELALQDLQDIKDRYRAGGETALTRFTRRVSDTFDRLKAYPRSSRLVEGREEVRRASLKPLPYSVFYVYRDQTVHILRILHTAQSPQSWPSDGGA